MRGSDGVGLLPAAGMPWFMTVFGRDTVITCLQTLVFGPELAHTALRALAELQAEHDDASIDAEPGKIIHELRRGRAAEVWFPRYYGSVDSTPLFLVLLSETWRWTADDALVRELEPAMRLALRWIDESGDRDGDGFVEFLRRSPNGLAVQSWKDSPDSQRFADGRIADGPIAASEVQGYVYDAKRRCAELARAVFGDQALAERLEREADELRERFDRAFWVEPGGFYALALDDAKQPVDSRCSNMGHLLWSGIVPDARVADVARTLLAPPLWSGWGVRTMSCEDEAYRPLAYHNGTVWPHDNSLCAHGLSLRGQSEASLRIVRSLLEAARFFDGGLPEVFAGLPRRDTPFPWRIRPRRARRLGPPERPSCFCASCSGSSPIPSSECCPCAPSGCPNGPGTSRSPACRRTARASTCTSATAVSRSWPPWRIRPALYGDKSLGPISPSRARVADNSGGARASRRDGAFSVETGSERVGCRDRSRPTAQKGEYAEGARERPAGGARAHRRTQAVAWNQQTSGPFGASAGSYPRPRGSPSLPGATATEAVVSLLVDGLVRRGHDARCSPRRAAHAGEPRADVRRGAQ
jgi:hypothetical protein